MMGQGINPAKIHSVLQKATDQQLMQMLKRPDKIPSMFIQQEMSRRRQMRQAASADMSKQQMTGQMLQGQVAQQQQPVQQQRPVMARQGGSTGVMGLRHGGSHYTGIDLDEQTGMPYAGAIRRDYLRTESPTVFTDKEKYGQYIDPMVYGPTGDASGSDPTRNLRTNTIGTPNMPTPASYGTIPINQVNEKRSPIFRGLRASEITDQGMDEGMLVGDDTNPIIGRSPDAESLSEVEQRSRETFSPLVDKFDIGPNAGVTSLTDKTSEAQAKEKAESNYFNQMRGLITQGANVNAEVPDTTDLKNQLKALVKNTEENSDKIFGAIDAQDARAKLGITATNERFNKHIANLENSQKDINKLFNPEMLKDLNEKSRDHYEKAIEFIKDDKSIVDAQKKLIDAMKPTQTPSQRFFGYVAEIGANIMGSDRDTFMEAGGDALGKALKDYKFDRKEDQERFTNQAKLMLEFEYQKRNNTMKAMEMKSNLYGMEKEDWMNENEYVRANSLQKQQYSTGVFGLESDQRKEIDNWNAKLDDNVIKRLELDDREQKNLYSLAKSLSEIEQTEFANKLELAKTQQDVNKTMLQTIPKSVFEHQYYEKLKEESPETAKSFAALISKNTASKINPDVTARTFTTEMMAAIKENGNDEQAAIKELGQSLYDKVKNESGGIDEAKLYQYTYANVFGTMSGQGMSVGASPDLIYNKDEKLVKGN